MFASRPASKHTYIHKHSETTIHIHEDVFIRERLDSRCGIDHVRWAHIHLSLSLSLFTRASSLSYLMKAHVVDNPRRAPDVEYLHEKVIQSYEAYEEV